MSATLDCPYQRCPKCREQLIHRDNRRRHEAASAFNQIVHDIGPLWLTLMDIDMCVVKWLRGGRVALRVLEHKQPHQGKRDEQTGALVLLDKCIRYASRHDQFGLTEDSGAYFVHGAVTSSKEGPFTVAFDGPQRIETLAGEIVLDPPWIFSDEEQRAELWKWMCHGPHGPLRTNKTW